MQHFPLSYHLGKKYGVRPSSREAESVSKGDCVRSELLNRLRQRPLAQIFDWFDGLEVTTVKTEAGAVEGTRNQRRARLFLWYRALPNREAISRPLGSYSIMRGRACPGISSFACLSLCFYQSMWDGLYFVGYRRERVVCPFEQEEKQGIPR